MTGEREGITHSGLPASRRARWRGVAAAVVIAVSGGLALAALHQPAAEHSRYAVVEQEAAPLVPPPDPLTAELLRCRTLPPQTDDPACRAAWEESRRRFFGESRRGIAPSDSAGASTSIAAPIGAQPAKER